MHKLDQQLVDKGFGFSYTKAKCVHFFNKNKLYDDQRLQLQG